MQLSSHFNDREDLLLHCQNKAYQFDQIRRAKHSTMMFLHHIFNPPSNRHCDACKANLEGHWFACKQCSEYDLCEKCFRTRNFNHDKSHDFEQQRPEANAFINLAKQQRQRRHLQRRAEYLVHAVKCTLPRCKYGSQCRSWKELWFDYAQKCPLRATNKCTKCNYVRRVLHYHCNHCRDNNCPVPNCRLRRRAAATAASTLGLRAQQSQLNDTRGQAARTSAAPNGAGSSSTSTATNVKEEDSTGVRKGPFAGKSNPQVCYL